jgi:hypothetical protein
MPDDKLTAFLIDLCTEKEVYESFAKDRDKVLRRKKYGLDEVTIVTILNDLDEALKDMIGTQQGGGDARAKEANRLARKAEALAKATVQVATSAATLAGSFAPPASGQKPAGKTRKKR